MTRSLAAVLFLAPALALAQQPPKEASANAAAKALNGSYTIKSASFNGKPAPDEVLKDVTAVEIKDGTLTITAGSGTQVAKFTLDPTATPPAIEMTVDNEKKPGIYKYEKGMLAIAVADKGARPKDFTPADGVKVVVFEAKKADPKK